MRKYGRFDSWNIKCVEMIWACWAAGWCRLAAVRRILAGVLAQPGDCWSQYWSLPTLSLRKLGGTTGGWGENIIARTNNYLNQHQSGIFQPLPQSQHTAPVYQRARLVLEDIFFSPPGKFSPPPPLLAFPVLTAPPQPSLSNYGLPAGAEWDRGGRVGQHEDQVQEGGAGLGQTIRAGQNTPGIVRAGVSCFQQVLIKQCNSNHNFQRNRIILIALINEILIICWPL